MHRRNGLPEGDHPRVYVVIDTLGQGGAEESTRAVLPLVRDLGLDVQVLLLRSIAPEREQALRDRGVPVRVIGPARGPLAVARVLRRELRAPRPALVHLTLFDPIVGGALARLGTGVPTLASVVNTPAVIDRRADRDADGASWKLRVARRVEAFVLRRLTTHVHAVTPGVATTTADTFGVAPERISVAYRGRAVDRFRPPTAPERDAARRSFGLPPDATVLVSLARHEPSKGLVDLVEAAALVRRNHPDTVVLIAGRTGATTAALEARIRELDLEGTVRLLGDLADPERVLAAADVFVLPSRREGTSGATIEAMATGLPIVATAVEGLTGITIDGRNALLAPVADPAALAAAVDRLLADAPLQATIARGARATFESTFTLEAAAAGMAALYRSVITR